MGGTCRRRLLFVVTLLNFCGFLIGEPSAAISRTLDDRSVREEVIQYLQNLDPDIARKFQEIIERYKPLVVFIPGILGTRLVDADDGTVLWGKSHVGRTDEVAAKLSYCSNVRVKKTILSTFDTGWTDENVYGKWIKSLTEVKFLTGRKYEIFPYDWRQDIDKSASDLDEFLLNLNVGELKNRSVVFVAHSMGGLVLTSWYYKNYLPNQNRYTFEIGKSVFLGTPHSGAPSTLKVLMEGYRTSHNRFFKFFESFIVGALDQVGYTFPSIYQLLPPDHQKFIRYTDSDDRSVLIPHFEADRWSEFNLLQNSPSAFKAPNNCSSLSKLLSRASGFHANLDRLTKKYGPIPNSIYYYARTYPTPSILDINHNLMKKWRPAMGDGHVLPPSAQNALRHGNGEIHNLRYEYDKHDELVDNESFHEELKTWLLQFTAKRDAAIWKLADEEHPEIIKALFNSRVVLQHSLFAEDTEKTAAGNELRLIRQANSDPTFRGIMEHNLSVLTGGRTVAFDSPEAARILYSSTVERPQTLEARRWRRQVYKIVAAISGSTKTVFWSLNNLGHMFIEDSKSAKAVDVSKAEKAIEWLKLATKVQNDPAVGTKNTVLKAKTMNNLGVAYLGAKKFREAANSFENVISLHEAGNLVAADTLRNARRNLINAQNRFHET